MRMPSFEMDGWRLKDGEQLHADAPATFHIPDLALRKILQFGDLAKLVFEIDIEGREFPAVERMLVTIREKISGGYIGTLGNKPASIPENDRLWVGTELPFEYRHIVDVVPADEESLAEARAPAPIPWDRSS
jgi:hypothetical protein